MRLPQIALDVTLTAVADPTMLRQCANRLGLKIDIRECGPRGAPEPLRPERLWVYPQPLAAPVQPGRLDPRNAPGVLAALRIAAEACLQQRADALVTAPVHKAVIARTGFEFTGHTEYLAQLCAAPTPVMLLAADSGPGLTAPLRVALATTHLPLRAVPQAITAERLRAVLQVLDRDLRVRFGLSQPRIAVCGLNPHAGEEGELGREEIEIIAPLLAELRDQGLNLRGPLPADTAFTPASLRRTDVVLAMYHDQGLPALKQAGFGHAVNVTLGLPILRTSADHGTALDLAGSGRADPGSLIAALRMAAMLAARVRAP
ncbi:MAG: 4-hydroxythreonine-4-phosphate dehydrogenase PdxA [Gammaproteobacteria bacterium]|nr:4-hydroxythreonine-4-phosphate dehydrogenase PdxA [Gammaproteobacteria bacterium]